MKYGLYSIRDVKTGFMTPVIETNDETAKRNFVHAVINSDGVLASYCQDFSLYHIGSFDSDSGLVSSLQLPDFVLSGSDAMRYSGKDGKDA